MAKRKRVGMGMYIMLGIMILAMGGFGLESVFTGTNSDVAIQVDDVKINAQQFDQAYRNRIAQESEQMGRPLSLSDARLSGLPEIVEREQIQRAALRDLAIKSDFKFSDRALADQIALIPGLVGADGEIDSSTYKGFLEARNLTENQLKSRISEELEQNLMIAAISKLAPKHDELLNAMNAQSGETRGIRYIGYDLDLLASDVRSPDESEMREYYEAQKGNYVAEPERVFDMAYLFVDPAKIDQTRIRSVYDSQAQNPDAPAQIEKLYVVNVEDQATAETITSSEDLVSHAQNLGLEEEQYLFLGTNSDELPEEIRAQIQEDSDELVFSSETPFGYSVYIFQGIQASEVGSFEDARDEIAALIAYDEMQSLYSENEDKLLDLVAGGSDPKTIAEQTDFDFANLSTSDEILGLTDSPAVKEAISTAELGVTLAPINLPNGAQVIIKVLKEEEPLTLPYEEVKAEIEESIMMEKKSIELNALHQALLLEVESGKSLEEIATAQDFELITIAPLDVRDAMQAMPLPLAFGMFGRESDDRTVWDYIDGNTAYLAEITRVVPFNAETPNGQKLSERNEEQLRASISNQILFALTNTHAIEVEATLNPALIDQITGATTQ